MKIFLKILFLTPALFLSACDTIKLNTDISDNGELQTADASEAAVSPAQLEGQGAESQKPKSNLEEQKKYRLKTGHNDYSGFN